MKKVLLLSILFALVIQPAESQDSIVEIPDIEFLHALIDEGVDTNGDNKISFGEAMTVNFLDLSNRSITDLTGIEAFIILDTFICKFNLIEDLNLSGNSYLMWLDCRDNNLVSIDLTGIEYLTYLDCSGNQLSQIDLSTNQFLGDLFCGNNPLSSIDLSYSLHLSNFDCSGDLLSDLDLTDNPHVVSLNCASNQLSSLNISNNSKLRKLDCSGNSLGTLDISGNSYLEELTCSNNQLAKLNISTNPLLTILRCDDNKLTSPDVSHNTLLKKLYCGNNPLSSLHVSSNTALTYLDCSSDQLTSLDVSNNTSLTYLDCSSNQITSLDLSKNTWLRLLNAGDMMTLQDVCIWGAFLDIASVITDGSPDAILSTSCIPDSIVIIPNYNFYSAVVWGADNNNDRQISYAEAEAVTTLDVSRADISDLTGIEAFINLETLDCSENQLTSLDVSNNPALTALSCGENQLTSLDVSNNPAMVQLRCSYNQLTSLNVSGDTALRLLWCSTNQLKSLNVTGNPKLYHFFCGDNLLTNLDVSNNPELWSNDTLFLPDQIDKGRLNLKGMPGIGQVCFPSCLPWSGEGCLPDTSNDWWEHVDTTGCPNVYFTTDCTIGIRTSETIYRINLYPNPANSLITIECEQPGLKSIEITSLNGHLIYTGQMEGTTHQLDMAPFSKGVYFVIVRSKELVRTAKVVKL